MANHKSAKKRIRTSERRRAINKASASKMKTLIKNVKEANNQNDAAPLLKEAVSYIDKLVNKKRLHKNTAARKKSSLTKFVNGLQ